MGSRVQDNFTRRFRNRVLLPGGLILLITAVVCGGALIAAGRGTDTMAALGPQGEDWRATAHGLGIVSSGSGTTAAGRAVVIHGGLAALLYAAAIVSASSKAARSS